MLVFVYGSLKQGEGNHHVLGNAKLIGKATTVDNFMLVDFGPFPALTHPVAGIGYRVQGEVYEVEDLSRLDCLEGYRGPGCHNHYDRYPFEVECNGETLKPWIYLYGRHLEGEVEHLPGGVWPSDELETITL